MTGMIVTVGIPSAEQLPAPEHNLTERTWYWVGAESEIAKMESVDESTIQQQRAHFDFKTNRIFVLDEHCDNIYLDNLLAERTEPQGDSYPLPPQFILKNLSPEWLVINQFRGNRNPIELKETNYDQEKDIYTVSERIAHKINRDTNIYHRENNK